MRISQKPVNWPKINRFSSWTSRWQIFFFQILITNGKVNNPTIVKDGQKHILISQTKND